MRQKFSGEKPERLLKYFLTVAAWHDPVYIHARVAQGSSRHRPGRAGSGHVQGLLGPGCCPEAGPRRDGPFKTARPRGPAPRRALPALLGSSSLAPGSAQSAAPGPFPRPARPVSPALPHGRLGLHPATRPPPAGARGPDGAAAAARSTANPRAAASPWPGAAPRAPPPSFPPARASGRARDGTAGARPPRLPPRGGVGARPGRRDGPCPFKKRPGCRGRRPAGGGEGGGSGAGRGPAAPAHLCVGPGCGPGRGAAGTRGGQRGSLPRSLQPAWRPALRGRALPVSSRGARSAPASPRWRPRGCCC